MNERLQNLAREAGHAAVLADAQESVEIGRQTAAAALEAGRFLAGRPPGVAYGRADDDAAAQEIGRAHV